LWGKLFVYPYQTRHSDAFGADRKTRESDEDFETVLSSNNPSFMTLQGEGIHRTFAPETENEYDA
jgi:hypothetical protein